MFILIHHCPISSLHNELLPGCYVYKLCHEQEIELRKKNTSTWNALITWENEFSERASNPHTHLLHFTWNGNAIIWHLNNGIFCYCLIFQIIYCMPSWIFVISAVKNSKTRSVKGINHSGTFISLFFFSTKSRCQCW